MSATGERRQAVTGTYNFRDTGGYRAVDGTTRWGKLYRSDALHRIDDAGRAVLAELGIAHIVDLRGDDERLVAASLVDGLTLTVHHVPVFGQADPAAQAIAGLSLAPLYRFIVDERGEALAEAIRVIASAGADEAVLVHCTAGKDRTGIVVALVLDASGVQRDLVVADYAATAQHLEGEWTEGMLQSIRDRGVDLSVDIIDLVSASPAEVMAELLHHIDTTYGSSAAYLRSIGITDDELAALQGWLLLPAADAVDTLDDSLEGALR